MRGIVSRTALCAAAVAAVQSWAAAQNVGVVLQEGETITGLPDPISEGTVLNLRSVRTDGQMGFAVLAECQRTDYSPVEMIWGYAGSMSVAGPMWFPHHQSVPEDGAWAGETEIGFALGRKGDLLVSQRMFRGPCGITGNDDIVDSVWQNTPNAEPPPTYSGPLFAAMGATGAPAGSGQPDWTWRSMSHVVPGGELVGFWTGQIRHETSGIKGGLWKGSGGSATLIKLGGSSLSGLPTPLHVAHPVRSVAASMDGSNHLEVVAIQHSEDPLVNSDNDLWLLRNMAPIGGSSPVATGQPVSLTGALTDETWVDLVALGVGTGTTPIITYRGRTSAASDQDEVLVKNGTIVLREGTTIDGTVIEGPIQCASANNSGDILAVWRNAITVNGVLALKRGDEIELPSILTDGQGNPLQPRTATVRNFLGPYAAALTSRKGDSSIHAHVIASLQVASYDSPGQDDPSFDGDTRIQALLSIQLENFGPASCPADFDNDDQVTVPDIFAFLSAWFAQDPAADFNGNSVIDVQDIFAFLSAWFAGCV